MGWEDAGRRDLCGRGASRECAAELGEDKRMREKQVLETGEGRVIV